MLPGKRVEGQGRVHHGGDRRKLSLRLHGGRRRCALHLRDQNQDQDCRESLASWAFLARIMAWNRGSSRMASRSLSLSDQASPCGDAVENVRARNFKAASMSPSFTMAHPRL